MLPVGSPTLLQVLLPFLALICVHTVRRFLNRAHITDVRGPPSPSFLYGYNPRLFGREIPTHVYEKWAEEYGAVCSIPWTLGTKVIAIMDPKALVHFYSRDTHGYAQTGFTRNATYDFVGNGILTAEGEDHRRQRRILNPSFSPASIRELAPVFYDAVYKLTASWDAELESNSSDSEATIEVQHWMTSFAMDIIGLAGFSHNFGTLEGKKPLIATALKGFGDSLDNSPVFSSFMWTFLPIFPSLLKLPIFSSPLARDLKRSLNIVGDDLLERVKKERDIQGKGSADRSIIGALMKAAYTDATMSLSPDELQGQMNTMLVAGYLSTSTTLTWVLIELSRHQSKQERLRQELLKSGLDDPTFDQLTSPTVFPYLDAVIHEVLRIHPAATETRRDASEDDLLPLSVPVTTRSGQVVSSIAIPKGSQLVAPILAINTFKRFWGPDAEEFKPERWIDSSEPAKDIQAYRHILTFSTGPRECLGKNFAMTELKIVISVLIRNYTFEFPGGPDTKIGTWMGVLPQPNVEGERGGKIPLIVRRVD
ncbi:cytochrome P450 [Mycena floridula]|nr:cytochrome P450 [Mycena floridula]